ncbi:MAG: SAM-dependent methyltransferase [Planctomycetota bacterium]|jgi:SAM-dependent methyltransferase
MSATKARKGSASKPKNTTPIATKKLPAKATARYEEFDWYETPKYYDAIFDVDSDVEGGFLEAAFEKHATPSPKGRRRVLEPACGSGRLMVEMASRGWKVHGFDLEPNMVKFSKERLTESGLKGTASVGNMANFEVRGTFDLAHCFVSTFKYLLTEEDARGHLQSVARALRPGGIYALGFHLSWYDYVDKTHERWVAEKDGAHVTCTISGWPADRKTRREKVQARMKVLEDGVEKRAQTTWDFRSYDARQVRSLVRSVPELEHVETYDFHYEIDEPQKFSDEQCDTLLILRKRG